MGFWQRLFGSEGPKPVPRKRGPSRSAEERRKAQELSFLKSLERDDPLAYRALMMKRLGIGQDKKDEFEQLEATVKKLKAIGVIKSANDLAGGGASSLIQDAIAGLGMFMQMQGATRQPAVEARVVDPPAATQLPLLNAVEYQPPAAAQVPPARQRQARPTRARQAPAAPEMTLVARIITRQLDGKSPDEAAAWLLAQTNPMAEDLVEQLAQTADEDLAALLEALASTSADAAGLVAWLLARPDWLLETVHAIREQIGAESPGSADVGL